MLKTNRRTSEETIEFITTANPNHRELFTLLRERFEMVEFDHSSWQAKVEQTYYDALKEFALVTNIEEVKHVVLADTMNNFLEAKEKYKEETTIYCICFQTFDDVDDPTSSEDVTFSGDDKCLYYMCSGDYTNQVVNVAGTCTMLFARAAENIKCIVHCRKDCVPSVWCDNAWSDLYPCCDNPWNLEKSCATKIETMKFESGDDYLYPDAEIIRLNDGVIAARYVTKCAEHVVCALPDTEENVELLKWYFGFGFKPNEPKYKIEVRDAWAFAKENRPNGRIMLYAGSNERSIQWLKDRCKIE